MNPKLVNFLIINETELRHELRNKHDNVEKLSKTLTKSKPQEKIILRLDRIQSILGQIKDTNFSNNTIADINNLLIC